MSDKSNLDKARKVKNDEFYTLYEDIEKEMQHWMDVLKGQSIYLFADTLESNFWKYFYNNFKNLELKELVATSLNGKYYSTINGMDIIEKDLQGNGDCRSEEVLDIMRAHLCITNPPFSIEMELLPSLVENNIQFLILAPETLVSRKNCFNYFKNSQIRYGFTMPRNFVMPDGSIKKLNNVCWLTSFPRRDNDPLTLTVSYSPNTHLHADNYDCINVDKLADIPYDYYGPIAVPITYMKKHCATQFKILGTTKKDMQGVSMINNDRKEYEVFVNGKKKFARIFIQRIKEGK